MLGKDIYKIWAPSEAKWIQWIRPVPFVQMKDKLENNEFCNFTITNIHYIKRKPMNTAIIVDLPSYNSIKEGIALAKLGFRPIPLYNGTNEQPGAMPVIDNHPIEMGLIWGALELEKIKIENDAPPVFLLDSNRTHQFKMDVSVFDNSWDIYDQDMPSAEYFFKNDIHKIIVRGEKIQKDLRKILYKFQKKKIKILFTDGYKEPEEIVVKKTPHKKIVKEVIEHGKI